MLPEHPAANIARREPAAQEYVHDDRWSVGEVAGDAGSHSFGLYQTNRSVPHLPSEHLGYSEPPENIPPMPPYDPTAVLDSFSAMHISGRSPSVMSKSSDPIPRAGSSMSYQSMHSRPHTVQPRPGMSLPPPSEHYEPPAYQQGFDDGSTSYNSPASYPNPYVQPTYNPQPAWESPPTSASTYDPFYAAASDILGMGPPGVLPPPPPQHGGSVYETYQPATYAPSVSSLSSSHSYASASSQPAYAPSTFSSDLDTDFEGRPALPRGDTALALNPNAVKSKAVDLTAPPYTKQYIDQYRQRIKGDPDPEAHFLYAKYLIDAARKIRASAKDQRSAKKYSELLVGEALKVVRKLATQGETYHEAQFYLANCYGTGALGLQVDHERAYHLYLQAAKQNHAGACYRVAVCNEIGAGTRKDAPRAAAFYRKAASLGDTPAMYKLGMILLHGALNEKRNPPEAVGWLRRAAEQADEENPHALHELALLHELPNTNLVQYDPILAKNLFTQAAHLGYTQSQYKLGQCYEYGVLACPVDPRRSIAWYTKAAEKGDAEAELALSGWYLTGSEGVLKQSDSEAYLWARRAANRGLSKAEYAVGYYAEVGIGIKQDIDFSKRWYMRAAAQGNKRAMNRLTEMKRSGNKRMNISRPTRQQAKDECVIT